MSIKRAAAQLPNLNPFRPHAENSIVLASLLRPASAVWLARPEDGEALLRPLPDLAVARAKISCILQHRGRKVECS